MAFLQSHTRLTCACSIDPCFATYPGSKSQCHSGSRLRNLSPIFLSMTTSNSFSCGTLMCLRWICHPPNLLAYSVPALGSLPSLMWQANLHRKVSMQEGSYSEFKEANFDHFYVIIAIGEGSKEHLHFTMKVWCSVSISSYVTICLTMSFSNSYSPTNKIPELLAITQNSDGVATSETSYRVQIRQSEVSSWSQGC